MSSLLIAATGFILWSISIIVIYYSTLYSSVNHIESASGFGSYLFSMVFLYGVYRAWIWLSGKKSLSFSFLSIIGIALFHIFIISIFYSSLPEVTGSPFIGEGTVSGMTLFIHILQLLLYPALLVVIMRSFGYVVGSLLLGSWKDIDMRLRVPAEITLGFFVFSIFLLGLGVFGLYTLIGVLVILGSMGVIGYKGLLETYYDVIAPKISLEYSSGTSKIETELYTFSKEFAFYFFTFLLSVSLISIIRPMPIGWDDLGVYMNFPKIMASTHAALEGAGMYSWQLITGTGFLFDFNASQAFYINQLGGILAVVFITSVLSYAFSNSHRKTLLALPILLATFYYAMPMTVFQQAKDMKLDPAYLAFSISVLGLLLYVWKNAESKSDKYKLILLIGVLVGFTFSIKFTSLMLILGALGFISYYYASFWGYVGFFFLFLALFTNLQLWGMMNVPMPKDIPTITNLSIVLGILALIGFAIDIRSLGKTLWINRMKEWFYICSIFLLGIGLACAPWITKNIFETLGSYSPKITISNLLGGSPEKNNYDYSNIYTPVEIEERQKRASQGMTTSGKSENEDMGRYFGYEEGLNNYLKLPANLTFQKNQGGEFTDISYLFLSLVPSILLFVSGRKKYSMLISAGGLLVLMALYYFTKGPGDLISKVLGQFTLIYESGSWTSVGYLVLILVNLSIVALIHYGTSDTDDNKKLRDVSVFMGIYAFLFVVAAFGIVWYGILIYFCFFLIIGLAANTFLSYTSDDLSDREKMGLNITLAAILFIFITTYFLRSAFPHGWNNLKGAYYNEYKYNILTQEESIFAYRGDYLIPIATMNLANIKDATNGITDGMQSSVMKDFLAKTDISQIPLEELNGFILKYRGASDPVFRKDIKNLGQRLYENILYPDQETANSGGIYRIGTFMTYLINKNNTRYFDDSLVMSFRDFFYDPSPEVTVDRMKKMGLKYLLVDLNAATIDRDPRRDLTTRFENLLKTMNASNLRLVTTDNFCLEVAISEKKKGKLITDDSYIDIAGTNYESYRGGITISRNQKLNQCHTYIIKLINEGRTAEYPTIAKIAEEVVASKANQDSQKLSQILSRHAGQSWFALFEILDTPVAPPTSIIATPNTGSGITETGIQSQTGTTK